MTSVVVVDERVLEEIRDEIRELREKIQPAEQKTWYTLHEAADLKGISYEVLRKRPIQYRPAFGRGTNLIPGSRKYGEVYHRDEVMEWLGLTEEEIDMAYEAYLNAG